MIVIRWLISMVMSVGITLSLFYFMQFLIAGGDDLISNVSVVKIVDATMPEIELDVIEEIEKPELIEDLQQEELVVPDKQLNVSDGPALNIERAAVQVDTGLELSNASISATDGEMLPLVAIAPQYPQRALQRGIEGWCQVSFTVDGNGNVIEDTIVTVDADPPNIFNRSSERAARRFKFQPRVVDGVGVPVEGVQYVFRYNMAEDN
ncbi:MAG: protein TonB [Pseudohongiella sp.]|nr:MAG: protein TonB [Pseudohongiella sp.]